MGKGSVINVMGSCSYPSPIHNLDHHNYAHFLAMVQECALALPFTGKGGIDGPAGPANAGPLSGAVRNAGPLFACTMSWTPPTLLSRCGNLAVEHAH